MWLDEKAPNEHLYPGNGGLHLYHTMNSSSALFDFEFRRIITLVDSVMMMCHLNAIVVNQQPGLSWFSCGLTLIHILIVFK